MEINVQKKEAESCLAEFEDALGALQKASGSARNALVAKCNQAQSQCRNQLDSYKLEMRQPGLGATDKARHNQSLESLLAAFRKLQRELEVAKQDQQRQQLMESAGENRDEDAETDGMATLQAQKIGDRLQDKTGQSLHNTSRQAKETLDIARNIELSMAEQEEKLQGVDRDLVVMHSSLARSKKLINTMAKQAAGDRCIQIMTCLIIVSVIILIVVYVVPWGEKKGSIHG